MTFHCPIARADLSSVRFVATILHPAFFTSGAARHIELAENQNTGRFESKHSINVTRYLNIPPAKGEALHGQPAPQVSPFCRLSKENTHCDLAALSPSTAGAFPSFLQMWPGPEWFRRTIFHKRLRQRKDPVILQFSADPASDGISSQKGESTLDG